MPRRLREKTRKFERNTDRLRNPQFPSGLSNKVLLNEGREINVPIDDISSKSDGISRIRGFPMIVPRSKVGERMRVKILKIGEKFAIAEKMQWEEKE